MDAAGERGRTRRSSAETAGSASTGGAARRRGASAWGGIRVADGASRLAAEKGGRWWGPLVDRGSTFRLVYNVLLFLVYVYVATVSAFVFSFLGVLQVSSPWFIAERCIDVLLLADMVLTFFTPYEVAPFKVVSDRKAIRRHYLLGWFPVDFVSLLPWDGLSLLLGKDSGRPDALQLPRFLRLLRSLKAFALLGNLRLRRECTRLEIRLRVTRRLLRILRLLFTVCLIAHWVACLFYFFGVISSGEESWIDFVPDDLFGLYIAALYFAVKTITTIGYGDVIPKNTDERVYTIVVMFLGAITFGYIVGQVQSIFSEHNEASEAFRKNDDHVMRMAGLHEWDRDLTFDARRYLLQQNRTMMRAEDDDLLDQLSAPLASRARNKLFRHRLSSSTLLHDVVADHAGDASRCGDDVDVVEDLCGALQARFYGPHQRIFKKGDPTLGFFLILSGEVSVVDRRGRAAVRAEEATFGEEDVLYASPRTTSARATRHCELLFVPRDAVMSALRARPTTLARLRAAHAAKLWTTAILRTEQELQLTERARQLRRGAEMLRVQRAGAADSGATQPASFASSADQITVQRYGDERDDGGDDDDDSEDSAETAGPEYAEARAMDHDALARAYAERGRLLAEINGLASAPGQS